MLKRIVILAFLIASPALADAVVLVNGERPFTFMVLGVMDGGAQHNERFFEGALPHVGQCAEMIYLGNNSKGEMEFNLHAKECGQ